MPGLDHPVHFTRSAPFHVKSGSLIFYDVVETSALSRSSVLSSMAECSGEAQLPESVTVSDFRKWLAAVTDSETDFKSRPFSYMCSVIKVADAVDDKHIADLVHIAAQTTIHSDLSSSPEQRPDLTGVLEGLDLLPDHLQRRIFAAAAASPRHLDSLLTFYPTRLHAAVLAAIITPEQMLRLQISDMSLPVIKAVASLPTSPPAVLSVHVQRDSPKPRPMGHARVLEERQEMLECLTQALHHHAGLTSLMLCSSSIIATPQQQLLLPIAKMTCLRSLDLAGFCCISADSTPLLRQALQIMPDLHRLTLRLTLKAGNSENKRKRDEGAPASPPCCLADLLSPATALTSLSLHTQRDGGARQGCRFAVSNPLALPYLVHLTATFEHDLSLAASFVTHLSAPLTSLHLAEGLQHPHAASAASAPAAQQLIHGVAAFTELRCFSAALPTDSDCARTDTSISDTLTVALPTLLATFHHLQAITLAAAPAMVQHIVPHLVASAPSLTKLCLGFYLPHRHLSSPHERASAAAWPDFFHALCQFELQHLDLDWDEIEISQNLPGMVALQSLTALTALRARRWDCVDVSADWQALARMTRLQHLCIDHSDLRLPQGCIASLCALSALTSLALKTAEEDEDLVPCLAAQLPPQSLPTLQQLTVSLYDPFRSAKLLSRYTAALPALKRLTVHLFPPSKLTTDPGLDFDRYDGRFSRVLGRCDKAQARLHSAATVAGVELVIHDGISGAV